MSDQERTENLRTLAQKLLDETRRLGDADAVAAAEKVHEHAHAAPPDTESLTAYLKQLEAKVALSPTVNAILQALSNIGI